MGLWLFKFDQPSGFAAMRAETGEFTSIASPVKVTVEPGDRVVIYNKAAKHLAAVLTVTEEPRRRADEDELGRRPYAFQSRPDVVSSRGPKTSVPGRNFRRLTDDEFTRLETVVRLNRN